MLEGLEYFLNLTLFLGSILFIASLTPVWAPLETLSMARAFDPALDLQGSHVAVTTLRIGLSRKRIFATGLMIASLWSDLITQESSP